MKHTRFLILALVLVTVLSTLAGCTSSQLDEPLLPDVPPNAGEAPYDPNDKYRPDGDKPVVGIDTIPEGLTGTDVAKLLLAEHRLDAHLINTEDNIFEDGAKTYRELAQKAVDSVNTTWLELSSVSAESALALLGASSEALAATIEPATGNRVAERESHYQGEGTTYDHVDEFCRSYEMFAETVRYIVDNAEAGAEMIDYVKKYVRVVDTWVKLPGREEELYLHVEENSETIFQRNERYVRICHRYKNEKGQNVYELLEKWFAGASHDTRSVYISGEKYELTRAMENGTRFDTLLAENTKGYWEVFTNISDFSWKEHGGMHAPSLFVMKDDICYGIGYIYSDGTGINVTLANTDRTSDILRADYLNAAYGRYEFELNMGAFEGVQSATQYDGGLGKLVLKNGTELELLTAYRDGVRLAEDDAGYHSPELSIRHLIVTLSAWGVESTVWVEINAASEAEAQAVLKRYLEIWGLTSKFGSLDKIFSELERGHMEAGVTVQHYKWHGYGIVGEESLDRALATEIALFEAMSAMYDEVKDAATVSMDDTAVYELLVPFSKLSEESATGIAVEGQTIRVTDLTLATKDTLLLIEGEPYAAFLGLQNTESGELIHVALESLPTTAYDGGDTLRVSTGVISLELPVLTAGQYTLVAYIATADGIRVSDPVRVGVESVVAEPITLGRTVYSAAKAEDGALTVTYEENNDVTIAVAGKVTAVYDEFYKQLADAVYPFGMPEQTVERLGEDGIYRAMKGDEAAFPDGEYRVAFSISNGENSKTGYALITYTASEAEEPPSEEPNVDPMRPNA
jgi:hypothetical protein